MLFLIFLTKKNTNPVWNFRGMGLKYSKNKILFIINKIYLLVSINQQQGETEYIRQKMKHDNQGVHES
jgi:hypothetical protein